MSNNGSIAARSASVKRRTFTRDFKLQVINFMWTDLERPGPHLTLLKSITFMIPSALKINNISGESDAPV